jgi:hypothetical protein
MRVANCKLVCSEIEEADHGQNLTASVMEHLRGCGRCQRFYDERRKLRQLIASLETVAAPPDFDLRVRSRLTNEGVGGRSGFFFSSFTFGFPSLALTTLLLVVGGIVALKVWKAPTTNVVTVHTEAPEARGPSPQREQAPSTEPGVRANADHGVLDTPKATAGEAVRRDRQLKTGSPSRSAVASVRNSGRLATREFSSTAAPLVKRDGAVASLESPIFLIETSSQPMRLSLDYSGGVSRTISVPALSFGSEGMISEGGSSLVKNRPKGAW